MIRTQTTTQRALLSTLSILHPGVTATKPEPDSDTLVLSYKHDFGVLWDLSARRNEGLLGWANYPGRERTIVILFDGFPDTDFDPVSIVSYVTPIMWALAFSSLVCESVDGTSPKLRILILYICDVGTNRLTISLPWIHEFSIAGSGSITSRNQLRQLPEAIRPTIFAGKPMDALSLLPELLDPVLTASMARCHQPRTILNLAIEAAKAGLITPAHRHNVGNILAPLFLSDGLSHDARQAIKAALIAGYPLRNALIQLVSSLQLVMVEVGVTDPGSLPENERFDLLQTRERIRVLLIDDQYELGYQHILGSVLFGEDYQAHASASSSNWQYAQPDNGTLICRSDPTIILRCLSELQTVDDWSKPRVLPLPENADVLVLDLRIWKSNRDKRRFFEYLLHVSDALCVGPLLASETSSFDPNFLHAYRAAQNLAQGKVDSSELHALGLLPLLLSHYDPSLPIVIFSSTHQRSVVHLMAHRHNIITDFSKPILNGYASQIDPVELIANLRSALFRAADLHEAAAIWKRLVGTDWARDPVVDVEYSTGNSFIREQFNKANTPQVRPNWCGEPLRTRLADMYKHYIIEQAYFDFGSAPFELLEDSLIPSKILNSAKTKRAAFEVHESSEPRAPLARSLQLIRNKKAHGHIKFPSRAKERQSLHDTTVLLFMLLLDFIEDSRTPLDADVLQDLSVDAFWKEYMAPRYGDQLPVGAPGPVRLVSNQIIDWTDFVLYSVLFALFRNRRVGEVIPLSSVSLSALQRLRNSLTEGLWRRILDSFQCSEALTAYIEQKKNRHEYVVRIPSVCYASMQSPKPQHLEAGAKVRVRIIRADKARNIIQVGLVR